MFVCLFLLYKTLNRKWKNAFKIKHDREIRCEVQLEHQIKILSTQIRPISSYNLPLTESQFCRAPSCNNHLSFIQNFVTPETKLPVVLLQFRMKDVVSLSHTKSCRSLTPLEITSFRLKNSWKKECYFHWNNIFDLQPQVVFCDEKSFNRIDWTTTPIERKRKLHFFFTVLWKKRFYNPYFPFFALIFWR